jgi:NAD(P)-dependent dehydrogenase (short-subunit alcohol dehydrogenase family)
MEIKLKPIEKQSVVVFGASSGIGRLAALEFARRGAKVAVAARSENGLQTLVEEIKANGGEAFYVIADAADFEQVKAVAEEAVKKFGGIDTWVHSAATLLFATVEQTEPEEYKRLIEVNLLGQIYGAKAALPHLKNTGGALILISSVEAFRTAPFQSAYGSSKHGLNGFIKALRVEVEHDEIPVSVAQILPAAINTPIYDKGRNKLHFKPRPVPPVYHPQIVVDTILFAAENPVKDLIAGAAGLGVVYGERISPRLTDFLTGAVGFVGQTSDEEETEEFEGNLFEPLNRFDTVEGSFSDEQLESDPYTWLKTHPRAKNTLLALTGSAIGGVLLWRALRKR